MILTMETSVPPLDSFLETFEVKSSSASSIQLSWHVQGSSLPFVNSFMVHYQKLSSTYIQYGPKLSPSSKEYEINNLVADTYYKVCLVTYRNDTAPIRECIDASTTNWQLPVSIGSSIGAILALSMIVLIALLSRCRVPFKYRRKIKNDSGRYNTMSSNFHDDHYEFSDTMTQGHEDDLMSDHCHEEFVSPENSGTVGHEPQYRHTGVKPGERIYYGNGTVKPHVHQSATHQHIGMIGRSHSQEHSYKRSFRANSIQAESFIPYSNVTGKPDRRHSDLKEWRHVPENAHEHFKRFPDNSLEEALSPREKHRGQHKETSKLPSATKASETSKQRSPGALTSPNDTVVQALNFIDETSCSSSVVGDSKDGARPKTKYKDLTAYGATGGVLEHDYKLDIPAFESSSGPVSWNNPKSVEMTSKLHVLGLPDNIAIEEHTV